MGEQTLAWGQIGLWVAYLLAYVVVVLALATADLSPQGVLTVLRRVLAIVVVLLCAAGVVAYQVHPAGKAPANPRVFVPSPKFFLDFSPSFRTSIADAYYLCMVQYYGEHVAGDGRLDSLPAMAELVTRSQPALHAGLPLRRRSRSSTPGVPTSPTTSCSGASRRTPRVAVPCLSRLLRLHLWGEGSRPRTRSPPTGIEGCRDPWQPVLPAAAGGAPPGEDRETGRRPSCCGARRTSPATSTLARRR